MARQQLTDGRIAPFSYITHNAMAAMHQHFEEASEVKLSTGLALYIGIAYLTSIEKARERGIEATREEIGRAGGVSATNVTRYAHHLVSAEVLELEQLVARGANVYRWTLVDPPFQAPHQTGEAGGAPLQGGDTPLQPGESPHQIGEAYIEEENRKKTEEETPCSPPEGDAPDPVLDIFDFWREATNRNGSSKLTPNRRRAVTARLKEGRPPGFIKQAIANVAASDWHMKRGRHSRREGRVHDDLTLICKNGELLEQYAGMGGGAAILQKAAPPEPTRLNAGELRDEAKAREDWRAAKARLRSELNEDSYRAWVEPLEAAGVRDGRLVLVDSTEHGGGRWTRQLRSTLVPDGYADVEIVDEIQLEYEAR